MNGSASKQGSFLSFRSDPFYGSQTLLRNPTPQPAGTLVVLQLRVTGRTPARHCGCKGQKEAAHGKNSPDMPGLDNATSSRERPGGNGTMCPDCPRSDPSS